MLSSFSVLASSDEWLVRPAVRLDHVCEHLQVCCEKGFRNLSDHPASAGPVVVAGLVSALDWNFIFKPQWTSHNGSIVAETLRIKI